MSVLSLLLVALENSLKATAIAEKVKASPSGTGVRVASGVRLFGREGKLMFVPDDGR
jgi:hypothetical protein